MFINWKDTSQDLDGIAFVFLLTSYNFCKNEL